MYEITNKAGVRGSKMQRSRPIQKRMQAKVQNAKRVDDIYKRDRNIKWRNGRIQSQIVLLANSDGAAKPERVVRLRDNGATVLSSKTVSKGTKPGRK